MDGGGGGFKAAEHRVKECSEDPLYENVQTGMAWQAPSAEGGL